MEAESIDEFSYHHSCHGTTLLHKLLVDVNRPLRHIILKYVMKIPIDDNPELVTIGELDDSEFDIPFNKLIQKTREKFTDDQFQELLNKHKAEMESIPIVYPILGVPRGVEVEIHYKIRGYQCQSVITRQFTNDPLHNIFPIKDYDDYIIIRAIGNDKNLGIIQSIQCKQYK